MATEERLVRRRCLATDAAERRVEEGRHATGAVDHCNGSLTGGDSMLAIIPGPISATQSIHIGTVLDESFPASASFAFEEIAVTNV
jgi:hypothetical protein